MLRFLRVRHFALIDQLELHFNPGFNLLSGETGAGKSILVDALGLLAGAKASSETIRSGETRAIVEAIFEVDLRIDLDRLGLDAEDDLIIRREISSDGRNRVYINNQPTTVVDNNKHNNTDLVVCEAAPSDRLFVSATETTVSARAIHTHPIT